MSSITYPGADPAFEAAVRERLDTIERVLVETATGDSDFVTDAIRHLLAAGGKRFRPMLVVLASELYGGADPDRVEKAAIVMELTHVASLYHDDVMDEADLRRGVSSANQVYGNRIAILAGDYLFSRASSAVVSLGPEYVALQTETFARLVQGQIAETRGPEPGEDPLGHYLGVIADKTGSLIAASAMFGGMVAGAPDEVVRALAAFGEEIGVVFQLSDDLLDIASDSSGKTPGTDLREGVPTLPALLLLAGDDPADARLRDLVSRPLDDDEVAEALAALRAHPVMATARAEIARRADLARGHLTPVPEGPAKKALLGLADAVVERSA